MKAKEIASTIGGFLLGIAVLLVGLFIVVLVINGAAWASTKLLPWFSTFTWIGLGLVVFVFLPLAIPRATRGPASIALLIASYVFGATLWMEGFLLTLSLWGVLAVVIGVLIAGVGVVPIAMLATVFNGMWGAFVDLILLTIMTFGARLGAFSLLESLEQPSPVSESSVFDE